ncbi:non-ribosomal peptide synthetase [Nostoc sp.]|uniref:non-ribosomal peptide synthetase n=1 Tax=Nostoc sp. TaxID=1180 RepID=UPI002FFC4A5B
MMISTKNIVTPTPEELFYQKIYWLNQLSGGIPETNFMTDYVRPAIYKGRNKTLTFEIPIYLSEFIINLAQKSELSIYLFLISTIGILIQKYTNKNDIIIGSPTYQKFPNEDFSNSIIPLRFRINNDIKFKDFLIDVKDTLLNAYVYQKYPFNELINLLELPDYQNRCPIFDIVVLLENIHKQSLQDIRHDLTFAFIHQNNLIAVKINYNEDLFQEETIKSVFKCYLNLVKCVIKDIKVSNISLLDTDDKQKLLIEFNKKVGDYPINEAIHTLFQKRVEQTPNEISAVYRSNYLTYQELNDKANRLAKFLQHIGVKVGDFVGILKDRDLNFIIGILAIFKAGGAYIPIDINYPQDRIKYMVSNAEVSIILTDYSCLNILIELLENSQSLKNLICLDTKSNHGHLSAITQVNIYDPLDFEKYYPENLAQSSLGKDPAYMLYTSGSTGLPKGAIVRHDGAINHIYAQYDELELTEDFCFLQNAPSSTDISVWQFLAPLLIGGKTVIVDIEDGAVPAKLFKVLKEKAITVVELVPAVFGELIDYISQLPPHKRLLPDLKWMMVVGEPVSVKRVNQWLQLYPKIKVADAYGPTEAADDITQFIIDQPLPENQRTVTIGKPLANLNIYILDQKMNLVPIGVPGEICVSGIGVGAGYWKNPEKTNLSFVPNPFTNNKNTLPEKRQDLIYKTGDLGRWLPDGNIEFIGRIDHQVKIRGFRVEIGEVWALLNQHPAVRENIIVAQKQEDLDTQLLLAYVVAKTQVALNISELRSFLKEKLPEYMLPSAFIFLEALPIGPSGKVDRKALPQPDNLRPELATAYVIPRNELERVIANLWHKALNLEKVGIEDNFFELGGHSLLMLQVYSKLREIVTTPLSLVDMFRYPTISSLSKFLSKTSTEEIDNFQEEVERLAAGKSRLKQRLQQRKNL